MRELAAGFDLVVGALPQRDLGYRPLHGRHRSRAGPTSTSASWPRTRSTSTPLAREHGVTAVVDCGVAPGISNLMVGYAACAAGADRAESRSTSAGCRASARWPFDYKAGFAPSDVIEEYVRPARMVEHGPGGGEGGPLTSPSSWTSLACGTLEAFNTDGLRSLHLHDEGALHEGEDAPLSRATST